MGDMQFNGTPEEWEALVKKSKIMNKQTAVEWLESKMPTAFKELTINKELLKQAKEMHKTDTEKVWVAGVEYAISVLKDKTSKESKEAFQQYYNETYGNRTENN